MNQQVKQTATNAWYKHGNCIKNRGSMIKRPKESRKIVPFVL